MSNTKDPGLDAQSQVVTLQLLREAGEYMRRLPAHPATYALAEKIRAHVDDPAKAAKQLWLNEQAKAAVSADLVRSGLGFTGATRFTPSGAPVIACRLLYPELRIESPAYLEALAQGKNTHELTNELAQAIANGITVELGRDVRSRSNKA